MIVEETFHRPQEQARMQRALSAQTYNLATLLLRRSPTGSLFVPIRTMQYLAVLDVEEVIFVERESRPLIQLSWQRFQPQARRALDAAVVYDLVYYHPDAAQAMAWLPPAFHKALEELEERLRGSEPAGGAKIVKLDLPHT